MSGSVKGPAAALALVGVVAVVAVAMLRVPSNGDVEASESTTTTVLGADSERATPEPVARLVVAGSGPVVDQALAGLEFAFSSGREVGVDVIALPTSLQVFELTVNNRNDADVIEVGFRLDALVGGNDAEFAPLDGSAIPSMSTLTPDLRLDLPGIVPFLDGAFGLARTPDAPMVEDWADLATATATGVTVVLPSTASDLAVVLAWALGEGDPLAGVDRYRELVAAGATPLRSTSDLADLARNGPVVAAWSSAGVTQAGRGTDLEFVVPASGAVALPGFTGILADSVLVDAAHDWLEFRLSTEAQTAVTFSELFGRFGEPDPVPPIPVVAVGRDSRPLTGFDPHSGDVYTVPNWTDIGQVLDEVRQALSGIDLPEG